jgi:hypothetical protein
VRRIASRRPSSFGSVAEMVAVNAAQKADHDESLVGRTGFNCLRTGQSKQRCDSRRTNGSLF